MENNNNDIKNEVDEKKVNKYKGLYKEKARIKYLANRQAIIDANKELYYKNKEVRAEQAKVRYDKNVKYIKMAQALIKQIKQQEIKTV